MKEVFNIDIHKRAIKHIAQSLIKGVTTKKGIPISCPVHCHSRFDGQLLSRTQSKSDGSYILFGLSNSANYVVAIDPAEEFNLATEDNIQ
ncbi:hypothetical protein [Acinetobacter bereziniae]|uniref:hypothetical protein n=1 Tax=Acinetobacter bereziniae TaxID=106648 RepID=UPI001117E5DB|nr:hypothetical protein [Acinetobacter bereziniae]TNL42293.1 hypothetical protein EYB59_22680 [Acinetobacter bereziniae]